MTLLQASLSQIADPPFLEINLVFFSFFCLRTTLTQNTTMGRRGQRKSGVLNWNTYTFKVLKQVSESAVYAPGTKGV